ncbi:hypothetical protein [Brachybacterium avium]|uniref:hypothetical protein n=1 Tax=Brachybacterium avium TaxID=2017485 RepID=UPI0012FDC75D|nr:hypothetical protein [Brachybacterium avium]
MRHALTIRFTTVLAAFSMLVFGMVALEVSPAHAGPITCLPTSVPAEQSSVSNSDTNDIQLNEHAGSEYETMCGGGIPSRLLTGSGGVKHSPSQLRQKQVTARTADSIGQSIRMLPGMANALGSSKIQKGLALRPCAPMEGLRKLTERPMP